MPKDIQLRDGAVVEVESQDLNQNPFDDKYHGFSQPNQLSLADKD